MSRRFQWRALTSVLIAGTFLFLAVSGVLLFVSPPGRVANWTDWQLLGLTKHEWTALHVSFSALFLITTVLHLIFNWRPMLNYFRNRTSRRFGWRWEWVGALLLCTIVFFGAVRDWTPFSQLLAWQESVKQSWDDPAVRAPVPHAELFTLQELAAEAEVDLELASRRLREAGAVDFTEVTRIETIAQSMQISAQTVYEIIAPSSPGASQAHPGRAGRGLGWMTLEAHCAEQGLATRDALAALREQGWAAEPSQTLREIAVNNGLDRPYALIEVLRELPPTP
jgi:hypothetical protein